MDKIVKLVKANPAIVIAVVAAIVQAVLAAGPDWHAALLVSLGIVTRFFVSPADKPGL